jgi:hypothetical protein
MAKFKLLTYSLSPSDMVKFAKVARVKRLNSSSLLRVLVYDFLKKLDEEQRRASRRAA